MATTNYLRAKKTSPIDYEIWIFKLSSLTGIYKFQTNKKEKKNKYNIYNDAKFNKNVDIKFNVHDAFLVRSKSIYWKAK